MLCVATCRFIFLGMHLRAPSLFECVQRAAFGLLEHCPMSEFPVIGHWNST